MYPRSSFRSPGTSRRMGDGLGRRSLSRTCWMQQRHLLPPRTFGRARSNTTTSTRLWAGIPAPSPLQEQDVCKGCGQQGRSISTDAWLHSPATLPNSRSCCVHNKEQPQPETDDKQEEIPQRVSSGSDQPQPPLVFSSVSCGNTCRHATAVSTRFVQWTTGKVVHQRPLYQSTSTSSNRQDSWHQTTTDPSNHTVCQGMLVSDSTPPWQAFRRLVQHDGINSTTTTTTVPYQLLQGKYYLIYQGDYQQARHFLAALVRCAHDYLQAKSLSHDPSKNDDEDKSRAWYHHRHVQQFAAQVGHSLLVQLSKHHQLQGLQRPHPHVAKILSKPLYHIPPSNYDDWNASSSNDDKNQNTTTQPQQPQQPQRQPDPTNAKTPVTVVASQPYLMSLRDVQSRISAYQLYRKGIHVPLLGTNTWIHPHFSVFGPIRQDYLHVLPDQLQLPSSSSSSSSSSSRIAMDIGVGSGVLTAWLLQTQQFTTVLGTDHNPAAIATAAETLQGMGYTVVVLPPLEHTETDHKNHKNENNKKKNNEDHKHKNKDLKDDQDMSMSATDTATAADDSRPQTVAPSPPPPSQVILECTSNIFPSAKAISLARQQPQEPQLATSSFLAVADLIVCNPPWMPPDAAAPTADDTTHGSSFLDSASLDAHGLLSGFLRGVPTYLRPKAPPHPTNIKTSNQTQTTTTTTTTTSSSSTTTTVVLDNPQAWLIMGDLAELVEVRTRRQLLHEISTANLTVVDTRTVPSSSAAKSNPKRPTQKKKSPNSLLDQLKAKQQISLFQLELRDPL